MLRFRLQYGATIQTYDQICIWPHGCESSTTTLTKLFTHIWIKYWINLIGSTWCLPSWCRFFRIRFVRTRRRRRCSRKTRSRRRRCPSRWTRESDEKKNTLFHENEFQIIRSSLTDISRNYFATLAILEIHFSNFFWNNLIRLFTAKVFSQKFSVDNFFGKF